MSEWSSSARGAEPGKGAGPSARDGSPAEALPLRLSLGRAGLSIELTTPREVSPGVVVEGLSLGLESLAYPLDLSKGVKQFRNRRTRLDELLLSVRLDALAGWVEGLPFGLERVHARLRNDEADGASSTGRDAVLGVVATGPRAALSFDLVLTFGKRPRFVLDEIVGLGLEASPLLAALSLVDALALRARELGADNLLRRVGRSCEVVALPRAALLQVLPEFGLRLPTDEGCSLVGLDIDASAMRFRFARSEDAEARGRRGLRLAGLADHLSRGDDLLAMNEVALAREAYLGALEQAPREVSCLLALGHLDASFDGRWESAFSYFEEARNVLGDERRPSVEMALAEHFGKAGDRSLAVEHYRVAARLLEPALAGRALLAARSLETDPDERRRLLDEAIRRAPMLAELSFERFQQSLADGDVGAATRDAERFLASARNERETAESSRAIGRVFLEFGHVERGLVHLQRAHRVDPTDLETRFLLARAFRSRGDDTRAFPVLVELAKELDRSGASSLGGISVEPALADLRLQLGTIYARVFEDRSLAVAELKRIESRGALGASARLFEAELLQELADSEGRLRAHSRLLEAAELGVLGFDAAVRPLLTAARRELEAGERPLAERMLAFLRQREGTLAHLDPTGVAELTELERSLLARR